MRAWVDNEPPTIKKLVDLQTDVISPNTASKNLQTFNDNITQTPTKERRPDEVNEMSPQAAPNPAGNLHSACEQSVIIKTNMWRISKRIRFLQTRSFKIIRRNKER